MIFGPWPSGVFFTGAATAPSDVVPAMYPVALAGRPYNIEPKLYRMSHIPVRRDATSETPEPGEASLNPAALWRRSQSDWSLGAGQTWLDEAESDRRRFRVSLGVDVFNDREATLLPATEEKRNSSATNLRTLVVAGRLYVVDGQNVLFSNGTGSEQNPSWATGWTTATGLHASSVLDIATSGSHVYVLCGDNTIYRATIGTTGFASWYNPTATATRMWAGLGRLFISDGRSLYEVDATPGETLISTHPDPNYVVSALCAGPSGVYVAGNIGTAHGEIRLTWVDDDGLAFVPPVVAAEFSNERINAMRSVGNNLVIGTSIGFRYAAIAGQTAGLDYGPAVEVGEVRDLAVESNLSPTGQLDTFVWFTWTSINGGSDSGLGRIRITRFTEPRVPAYASDIYASTGGTVLCVASLDGRRYFGVSTDGFYGATDNFVDSGTLSTGRIRYGVLDDKVFSDLKWRTAPLDGTVSASVAFDTGGVASAGTQTRPDSTSNEYASIGPVSAEWAEITFTLTSGGEVTNAMRMDGLPMLASTPDDAGFAITDLDYDITLSLDTWSPGGLGTLLGGQWPNAAPNNGWAFGLDALGRPTLLWTTNGTTLSQQTATTPLGFAAGSVHNVGVQFDVNDGAGGREITFTADGAVHEVLTGASTSIFNSTVDLEIGLLLGINGYVYDATLRDAIGGTAVADPVFSDQAAGTSSFADDAGNTWTLADGAEIVLVPGSDSQAPKLRWWVLRAIPAPENTIQFLVPLILTEKTQTPLGPTKSVDFLAEVEFLTGLANTKQIVTYQEGLRSYVVYVNNVEFAPTQWNRVSHGHEGILMTELHSVLHP